jgi:D-alanyl-D-alanine carboxypeptidase
MRLPQSLIRFLCPLLVALAAVITLGHAAPARAEGAAYASCGDAPKAFVAAAKKNADSIDTLDWAPFGPHEKGWAVYEILLGQEIGSTCGAGTPGFAQALAAFQEQYHLTPDGVFTPATFEVFKGVWQERRPFVMLRIAHLCPDAPATQNLTAIPKADETFDREDRALRTDTYKAYQDMLYAARSESGPVHADPKSLTIFSGYRSPASDAVRCETEHNCDGAHRASCSAHRTGTAIDVNVGYAVSVHADDASADNRMLQTRTPAYRWMVQNAKRFGFVNYAYEPWHWEYVRGPLPATAPPVMEPPSGLMRMPGAAALAPGAVNSAGTAVITVPSAHPSDADHATPPPVSSSTGPIVTAPPEPK